MAWQTVEERLSTATRKDASMRLVLRGESSRPACVISFRKDFSTTVAWKAGDPVGIQIGAGEHAGRIRIVRLKKGAKNEICVVRKFTKGAMTFDFGFIPQLGDEAHDKQGAEASLIDADTVEVVVPAWNDSEVEEDDEQEGEPPRDPPAPRPSTAASRPAPIAHNGATVLTKYGITLDLAHEAESIEFKKKTMDLTTRQAAVVAALMRGYPQFVGRQFILKNALADMPSHAQEASLDLIVSELTKALAGIGLQLRTQKGVGLALGIGG